MQKENPNGNKKNILWKSESESKQLVENCKMREYATSRRGYKAGSEMALVLLLLMASVASAASHSIEMGLANITRFATGDLFSLVGSDCGPTRCMEVSHGTALAAMGGGDSCVCQCRRDTPAFREDQRICVNHVEECLMASFGRGATKPQIPFVFLPLKGQIIYPSKEIIFTDVDDAICAVTSAQYLSPSGWVTLRDLIDNDVPFSLYRDEGSTFLQWRGSSALHTRLEGRLVAAHVLCSAPAPTRLAASCAAFRVAGASHNSLLDVRSIPFHAGEIVTTEPATQNQGLSVLESLAIGVCVLMLIFVYAAGIIFYIHYKQRQKRKDKDPENNTLSTDNGSTLGSRIDLNNVMLKTNPLLKMDNLGNLGSDFFHDVGLSDVSEHTEDTLDSSPPNSQKFQKLNSNVISAMVHTRRKKPSRPSIRTATPERMTERFHRRSASPEIERAPHSELAIVDCSDDKHMAERQSSSPSNGDSIRRKLYFNPVFFETEHLKNPPPAAVEFLLKIREVMGIAKEKMTTKRFIPILSDIPEEESYHSIDLGWDIPCARRGRRFSAISLKRENSRRSVHCGGCPGCDSREPAQKPTLTRSNSCKSCVSDDYKQRIVRKWLDEVPSPKPRTSVTRPVKSVAKVNGTPRLIDSKPKDEPRVSSPSEKDEVKPVKPEEMLKITESSIKEMENLIVVEKSLKIIEKDKSKKVVEKPTKLIEKPIKVIEKLKKSEGKLAKVVETIPKEQTNPIRIKELPNRKDFKGEKPRIIHHVPLDRESNMMDEPSRPAPSLSRPITPEKTTTPMSAKSQISPTHEKKTSSKHASRRIRKKLPPPPPPPTIPPKPVAILPEFIPESPKEDEPPILPEVKIKMEAVIKELNKCRRGEPKVLEEIKTEVIEPIPPKIVIPVYAADTHYFSDDNTLSEARRKQSFVQREPFIDFDSLERTMLKKRRFSLACGPELNHKVDYGYKPDLQTMRDTLTRSWRDIRKVDSYQFVPPQQKPTPPSRSLPVSEVVIDICEPLYDNVAKPGPLTIQVTGSPIEIRRHPGDEFDPDTLDRKPKREAKKRVEKILLKSGGSFKHKSIPHECGNIRNMPEPIFTRKIGSLRQIYEAKAKSSDDEMHMPYYERRGSVPYAGHDLAALVKSVKTSELIRKIEGQRDIKPPVVPKQRRGADLSPKFNASSPSEKRRTSEERERYQQYLRGENLNARRSARRSNRTRSRRTDLRKLYRTEDSGYLSTDSNESKRRANYLMQLKPKIPEPTVVPPPPTVIRTPILQHIESDTDDMESICDGRSESGGESIETDSVFFGNFDESKQMLAELGVSSYDFHNKLGHEQIDSGFMGETNIILSGDSDSEHRSVISIVTGRDGRASAASITQLDETPYMHSVEC